MEQVYTRSKDQCSNIVNFLFLQRSSDPLSDGILVVFVSSVSVPSQPFSLSNSSTFDVNLTHHLTTTPAAAFTIPTTATHSCSKSCHFSFCGSKGLGHGSSR